MRTEEETVIAEALGLPDAVDDGREGEPLHVTRGDEPISMRALAVLVERLGRALPATTEIILHDFADLDATVAAVGGSVTRRNVGDPPTDVLLRHIAAGARNDLYNYDNQMDDGRPLISSTLVLRSADGEPVGALCMNQDVSAWRKVRELADAVLEPDATSGADVERTTAPTPSERFPRSIEDLADLLIEDAIAEIGVPLALMRKEHKVRVVANLHTQGMFLLRDAIELVGQALGVTRFTVYKYLNELELESPTATAGKHTSRDRPGGSA